MLTTARLHPACSRRAAITVTSIAAASGGNHACALLSDTTVQCWGLGTDGQLGTGGTTSRSTPVAVPGLSGVVQIAAGAASTYALLSNYSVLAWGSNNLGQLGDGTLVGRTTPGRVLSLGGPVVQIVAGARFACAILNGTGTAQCWGE